MSDTPTIKAPVRAIPTPVRAVLVLALLYLFLTGVELLGGGF